MLLSYIKLFKKSKRGLEPVSLAYFFHDFWRKIFLMLYYIYWSNFIVWLPLHLQILGIMCKVIICCPICDVINFEINLSMTKKSGQKCKYLTKEKKAFTMKWKAFFIMFKELSVVTNCLRPKSGPLQSEILVVLKCSPLPWRKLMFIILK